MVADIHYDGTHVVRPGESIQNWMCGGCHALVVWFQSETACCKARTVAAYSHVRCPLCLDTLPGWNLYDDGVTRPCACSTGMVGHLPAQPNPDQREAVSAYVLGVVGRALVPSCRFPTIVPRRAALSSTAVAKEPK